MHETARSATADDLTVLEALASGAQNEMHSLRGGYVFLTREARPGWDEASLQAALTDDRSLVVVGTIDDEPVGYGAVHVEHLRSGESMAVVDDLYVLPGARGVGVGEAMMNDLVAFARNHHCIGIDAVALPGDRHTKNFFETFGLVARAIVVHRSLEP